MEGWDQIVELEGLFLDEVANRLEEIGAAIDETNSGNDAVESIYAAMLAAYQAAEAELPGFQAEIQRIESQGRSGVLDASFLPPQSQQQLQMAPPQMRPALGQLLVCFRVCMQRPSDTFRNELRRQIGNIMGSLQQVIMSGQLPPAQAEADVKAFCTTLCAIEQPFVKTSSDQSEWSWGNLLSWPGIITMLASAGVGYFAGPPIANFVSNQYNKFMGRGKEDLPPELPEGRVPNGYEEDMDLEEIFDEGSLLSNPDDDMDGEMEVIDGEYEETEMAV